MHESKWHPVLKKELREQCFGAVYSFFLSSGHNDNWNGENVTTVWCCVKWLAGLNTVWNGGLPQWELGRAFSSWTRQTSFKLGQDVVFLCKAITVSEWLQTWLFSGLQPTSAIPHRKYVIQGRVWLRNFSQQRNWYWSTVYWGRNYCIRILEICCLFFF